MTELKTLKKKKFNRETKNTFKPIKYNHILIVEFSTMLISLDMILSKSSWHKSKICEKHIRSYLYNLPRIYMQFFNKIWNHHYCGIRVFRTKNVTITGFKDKSETS